MLKNAVDTAAFPFDVKGLSGKAFIISDLKGIVLLSGFWETWCCPWGASFPMMQKRVDKYERDKGVVFLFIHTMESGDNPTKAAAN